VSLWLYSRAKIDTGRDPMIRFINNRSFLIVIFILAVFSLALAHGGEDHGEEASHKPATGPAAPAAITRSIQTGQGLFKITLNQRPAVAIAGREVELEIEVAEEIEGGFSGGLLPVEGAKVRAEIKSASGEMVATALETHTENKPGVYGVHYTLKSAGDYKLNFAVSTTNGVEFVADFPLSILRAPVNYLLYGAAVVWLLVGCCFGIYRFRRVRREVGTTRLPGVASSADLIWRRLMPEYAILLPLAIAGLFLIEFFTPPPAEPAQTVASASTVPGNGIVIAKEAQFLFGIKTIPATQKRVTNGFQVNGLVRARPQSRAAVTAPITGLMRVKRAITVGDIVEKGEALAAIEQVLSVPDQISLQSYKLEQRTRRTLARDEAEHTRQRLVAANVELNRVRKLYEAGAASLKQLQEAEQRVQFASVEAAHAQQTLIDVGDDYKDPVNTFTLKAPITGIVAAVDFVNGEQIEAGKTILTIMDLSTVWIEARVFEADLPKVYGAKNASYRVPAVDESQTVTPRGRERLFTIGTSVNQDTRTVPVYFEVANTKNLLRDGMAAEIWIDTSSDRDVLTVPQQAVVSDRGEQVVFVYKGGELFERRVVQINPAGPQEAEVVAGLKPDERVVTEGLYQLRASMGK
jgi:membrane fusion protein, heavy metal efflux system